MLVRVSDMDIYTLVTREIFAPLFDAEDLGCHERLSEWRMVAAGSESKESGAHRPRELDDESKS